MAEFGVDYDGTPFLSLKDQKGHTRSYASVYLNGTPSLEIMDGKGNPRIEMLLEGNENPRVYLRDETGKIRSVAGVDKNMSPFLAMLDETSIPRFYAGASSLVGDTGQRKNRDRFLHRNCQTKKARLSGRPRGKTSNRIATSREP